MDFRDTKYKNEFRTYQQRVLKDADKFFQDGKIHIVAAPGSGKTILGLELIRRKGDKALIVSPSLAIRKQWVDRFTEGFLSNEQQMENWCGEDLEEKAMITSMTYQGLYAAMSKEPDRFIKKVKAAGIKTFCFDEAHHLKKQWWMVLEELTKAFPKNTRICLTATPPYDSDENSWNNYINLCGEIDCEIFIPELVKENSLCPHQDYIYMSLPVENERNQIAEIKKNTLEFIQWIMNNEGLRARVENHCIFHKEAQKDLLESSNQQEFDPWEIFYGNPDYLTAFLMYCQKNKIEAVGKLKKLIGKKIILPEMNPKWMESFLQGILFIDPYFVKDECIEEIENELRKKHLLRGTRLYLDKSEKINKLLTNSQGKFEAIANIVKSEKDNLGNNLRMLILTDYIKKDGGMELGAVPIYDYLKKQGIEDICLLTGSIAKLPDNTLTINQDIEFEEESLVEEENLEGEESLTEEEDNDLDEIEEINNKPVNKDILEQVREQLRTGKIKIIVGTVAYLGEGWDAPEINSLILATTISSYVSSNQMRGRAIRQSHDDENKTSAIWHLLTMDNTDWNQYTGEPQLPDLRRRFQGFMGLTYYGDVVENGIERLQIPLGKISETHINKYNNNVLIEAGNRNDIKKRWDAALFNKDGANVKERVFVQRKAVSKNFHYYNSLLAFLAGILMLVTIIIDYVVLPLINRAYEHSLPFMIVTLLLSIGVLLSSKCGYEFLYKSSPQARFDNISEALLNAMKKKKIVGETAVLYIDEGKERFTANLENSTIKEDTEFAKALVEFYSPINNPRYMIIERGFLGKNEYYSLPSLFANKKEDVDILLKELNRTKGSYQGKYLRNPSGRKLLMKARLTGYANVQRNITGHKSILS